MADLNDMDYQPPENGADCEPQSPDAGPTIPTSSSEPPADTEPAQVYDVHSVPGPNEVAIMLGELSKRENYGARVALEARCDMAKLFALMVDVHKYKGKQYEQYCKAHGAGKSPKDAYRMYKLASVADDVLAKCAAKERIDPRFEYPTLRQVVNKYFPQGQDTGEDAEDPDGEDILTPKSESAAAIAKLTRERDNFEGQVKACTQQFRNERIKREEIEEKWNHDRAERDRLLDERNHLPNERGLWDTLRPDSEGGQPDDCEPVSAPVVTPDPVAEPVAATSNGIEVNDIGDSDGTWSGGPVIHGLGGGEERSADPGHVIRFVTSTRAGSGSGHP